MKTFMLCLALVLAATAAVHAEMRGAWIASVHNINFPTKSGLSASAQKAQLISLLDTAKRSGLNAVFFQVRPESDALYASKIEPWSRYLTGTQGKSPGYDPLAFLIAEAKKRGIEVHAWLNPYRAVASAGKPTAANHISRRYPQYAYRVGSVIFMDPGAPAVRKHILKVVQDLVQRYDLDGVHYDDYFYPYPNRSGKLPRFPDDRTYAAYRKAGGKLSKADWRRANVNTMIRQTADVVRRTRPGTKFGVSPFGIYRPGVPEGIKAGVDTYGHLYADPVRWMREGSVDYLAPQLYWKDGGPQSFSKLISWWRSRGANPRGVPIYPGVAVDRMTSHRWPSSEIKRQLSAEKATRRGGKGGYILWNIKALKNNTKNVRSVL